MSSCNIYILKKYNLILFAPAKSGGSSFKKYFLEKIVGTKLNGRNKHTVLRKIPQETADYKIFQVGWDQNKTKNILKHYSHYSKCIIIRNPFKRFVSSFYSKFVNMENGNTYFNKFFKTNILKNINNITFEHFINTIIEKPNNDCHFTQQINNIMTNINFDHCVNLDYMTEDLNIILSKYGLPKFDETENRTKFAKYSSDISLNKTRLDLIKNIDKGIKHQYKSFYNKDLLDKVKYISHHTFIFIIANKSKFIHPIDFEKMI
jgi:hypothetical protein